MTDRSATSTIKGYFYQFDYTILQLLRLKEGSDSITIEGIEDVDIDSIDENTAIQCKYYESTEYNHSKIGKPIRLMLNHFKEVKDGKKSSVNYYLYGYYQKGQEKLNSSFDIEFLKETFLTYTENGINRVYYKELNLTNADLKEFLEKLTIDINAADYNLQLNNIAQELKNLFNCSDIVDVNFYYNNALSIIKELSVQKDIKNRKISKESFLKKIDNKEILFNKWFLAIKGKRELLRSLRRKYFSPINVSPYERVFLIEVSSKNYSRAELKMVLQTISTKWSKISKRESKPFCPYVYLHNIPELELVELKKELREDDFKMIDGYDFMGASFSKKSICQEANNNNQIKLKIINELSDFDEIMKYINKTKEVYEFYINSPFSYRNFESINHVKIQFQELSDIKEVV